jgi:hypothetical protein
LFVIHWGPFHRVKVAYLPPLAVDMQHMWDMSFMSPGSLGDTVLL